jgi:hypothetical protein
MLVILGVMALYLGGITMFLRRCINDAGHRGSSRMFVLLGVVDGFPIG